MTHLPASGSAHAQHAQHPQHRRGPRRDSDGLVTAPDRWARFESRDADEAHDFLRRSVMDHEVRAGADAALRAESTVLGSTTVNRLHYYGHVEAVAPPHRDLVVHAFLDPLAHVALSRRGDVPAPRRRLLLVPPDHAVHAMADDFAFLTVVLPRALVDENAEAVLDLPSTEVRYDLVSPRSAVLGRLYLRTLDRVCHTLLRDGAPGGPVAVATAERQLAAAVVAAFATTSSRPGPRGWVAPDVVRRAVAHAEEHLDQPLTVTALAGAAGVGVRALQEAFRRHLGTTPTAFVRDLRLERAHHDLVAADRGATVASIAGRWGFADPDVFARHYGRRYGAPPSTVLRSADGNGGPAR